MAMTKKEKEYLEKLETKLSLKFTDKIIPDINIPNDFDKIINGYSFNVYSERVFKSCSSSIYHGLDMWDKTNCQSPIRQYSTRILALKALRNEMENRFAQKLREIDLFIQKEEGCLLEKFEKEQI